MGRRPWREISAKNREDPERAARIEAGARAMLLVSALTKLRESRDMTQTELASALDVSQARVSRLERQDDLYLSTLAEYVRAIGGELRVSVVFPDETVELVAARD
ncbi:MAG TPA: XRE family transcriptional regulator [Thermomicrobiales bacterium]|jgi:transcriptional regulator with XRE-family HTH domain